MKIKVLDLRNIGSKLIILLACAIAVWFLGNFIKNFSSEESDIRFIATFENINTLTTMGDLIANLYSIEYNAYVTLNDLNVYRLANMDLSVELSYIEPTILIFHTHSQEDFIDSRPRVVEDTIVGVGQRLAQILTEQYNISVIHDTGQYDVVEGEVVRIGSYERMEPAIRQLLEIYPTIEVLVDLHRDGVPEHIHFVTEIDGRQTAKLMYFNGITRLNEGGMLVDTGLVNPYLEENLAFSLQMQLTTNELFPDLTRRIYIKPYRYSLHMKPRSLLVEVGANTNTVEEAMNAMIPLAEVLVRVLKGQR